MCDRVVSIKNYHGNYCTDADHGIVCNPDVAVDAWESFAIKDVGNGEVSIKGGRGDGQFCQHDAYEVNDSGNITLTNSKVICNQDAIGGAWEKFKIEDIGSGKSRIKSSRGDRYCSVNESGVFHCVAEAAGPWEEFTLSDV